MVIMSFKAQITIIKVIKNDVKIKGKSISKSIRTSTITSKGQGRKWH